MTLPTAFLGWLTNNPLARWIGAALAAIAGILAYGGLKKREGRQEAAQKAKEKDRENASDIRRRAADADGVRDEDIEFRD